MLWVCSIEISPSTIEQHILCFVYFRCQISWPSIIRMIIEHQCTMFQLYRRLVRFIHNTDYQLRLSQSHLRIETSRIHSVRVQVVAISDMTIHFKRTFDYSITRCLRRPRVISPAPKVVLIINIIIIYCWCRVVDKRERSLLCLAKISS